MFENINKLTLSALTHTLTHGDTGSHTVTHTHTLTVSHSAFDLLTQKPTNFTRKKI